MLIHCDGYDHYVTAQAVSGQKWDTVAGATIGSTYARNGGQGCQLTGNGATLSKAVLATTTYILGTAIKGTLYGTTCVVMSFKDGGTTQVDIRIGTSGTITATRNGTLLATATPPLPINQYHYLEAKVFINSTTGTVTVRLDGVAVISFTGNTQATGAAQITNVALGSLSTGCTFVFDDTVILDTTAPNSTGNNNADFLGDVVVTAMYPSADGALSQFARGGTDSGHNYSQVNEASPDDDTKYVADNTVNDRDSYKFPSLAVVGSIFAVVVWTRAKKDDVTPRTISSVARNSAIDLVGTAYSLSSTYAYFETVFEVDPATRALWTPAGLNSAEFGSKIIT